MSIEPLDGKLWFVPRILLVENDLGYRQVVAEILRHYHYTVYTAEGSGDMLIADAKRKVVEHRCHLALVDMRLINHRDPDDRSGLDLIKEFEHPTVSVMISAYGDRASAVAAVVDNEALDFVGKQDGPQEWVRAIDRAGQKAWMWRRTLEINDSAEVAWEEIAKKLAPDDTLASWDEARTLIGQLFPEAKRLKILPLADATRTPSATPRQRSLILQVWQDDRMQPQVVKLARKPRIEDESRRYKEYIDGQLDGNVCARLERFKTLWSLGGAVYVYMGTSRDQMQSFSRYYVDQSPRKIIQGLTGFFAGTWSGLYDNHKPEQPSQSLFHAYSGVWGTEWHNRLRTFPNKATSISYPQIAADLTLPNPVHWLVKRVGLDKPDAGDASDFQITCTAITHGDLFGDNVFVDTNGQLWVIDYERTGWGPILQDFVELETDILTRLADFRDADLSDFFKLVTAIITPKELNGKLLTRDTHPQVAKALKVIQALRSLARQQTRVKDARQYLWGLLLNSVFRATFLEENDPKRERTLLLGSLICYRLDYWDAGWPPSDWGRLIELRPSPAPRPPRVRTRRTEPQTLRIVVASPGDVQAERDNLEIVVAELNRGIAAMAGLRLELVRWETDAYPGFHNDGPQGLIDPVLRIESADVLIGIFWKRFGTPVADAKSGTEHEFRLALESWRKTGKPQIMIYFNQRPYMPKSPDEADQQRQVLQFKAEFPREGLWWSYRGKGQFERLVRNHLSQLIRQQGGEGDDAGRKREEH